MSGDGPGATIRCSAPGKVILFGEHSVVYGKLAIAASLGLRTTVFLEECNDGRLEIRFKDLGFRRGFDLKELKLILAESSVPLVEENSKYNWKQPETIDHDKYLAFIQKFVDGADETLDRNRNLSLVAFLYLYFGILTANDVPSDGLIVSVGTDLTLGAGTGSSASLMVSLAGALFRYHTVKKPETKIPIPDTKVSFNKSELNLISEWAFCAEKIIHGNPSGIDNSICTFGSMVSFRKGSPPADVKSGNDIRGLLVDTRVPKNTGVMVKLVSDLKNRHPKVVESVLDGMDELSSEAAEYLACLGMLDSHGSLEDIEDCYKNLNELSDVNHNLLRTLGVSHPSLDDVVSILRSKNLHGKITGAGGGGYIIALIPPTFEFNDLDNVCAELSSKGYKPLITKLGGPGVSIDL